MKVCRIYRRVEIMTRTGHREVLRRFTNDNTNGSQPLVRKKEWEIYTPKRLFLLFGVFEKFHIFREGIFCGMGGEVRVRP